MTLRQAAEQSGLSATTLRRYIKAGRLRARLIPGRYGPEYVVDEDDLAAANVPRVKKGEQKDAEESSPAADGQRALVARGEAGGADAVPGLLYRELMMKHEHLLVQYGMLRVSGQQLYEVRQEAERRAREARDAAAELRRIQDRHAGEIGALKTKLRQAELKLAERNERIDALRRRLSQLEMRLRNAATASKIDSRFSQVVGDQPSEEAAAELIHPPAPYPDH